MPSRRSAGGRRQHGKRFRSQQPAPTPDQITAFRAQMHAAVTAFVEQHRDAVKAFRKGQLASVKACATNA